MKKWIKKGVIIGGLWGLAPFLFYQLFFSIIAITDDTLLEVIARAIWKIVSLPTYLADMFFSISSSSSPIILYNAITSILFGIIIYTAIRYLADKFDLLEK